MKVFKTSQVREIDQYTIDHEPIFSIDLMERAAMKFANWFALKFDRSIPVYLFAGPGNNGGDGLAVARILSKRGFLVKVFLLNLSRDLSKDCNVNYQRLQEIPGVSIKLISQEKDIPVIKEGIRIIDAIFGSGLTRPLVGLPSRLVKEINNSGCEVVSIDIPSGLFGEDNTANDPDSIIKADFTLSFEFPFLSFFFPENEVYTGKWKSVSIGLHPDAIHSIPSDYQTISREFAGSLLKEKSRFSHKGSNGHALIVSGCYGMMGAAILACKACIRSGAGLVTSHIPRFGYSIMQTSVPESLISLDESDILFSGVKMDEKYTAIGLGPGLNCRSNTEKGVVRLIKEADVPLLLDADAINILSGNPEYQALLAEKSILTPHPGEFDRLAGKSLSGYERHQKQLALSKKHGWIIVLKGSNTIISFPDGKSFINTSGNPGLATGGSGDVLSGMITGLLAQGYSPSEAAILGVYLHGLAADLALEKQSYESLIPSDVIDYIGRSFNFLRE